MKRHDSRDIQVRLLASSYRLANRKEVSNFGKSINDNEDGIISFLGFWKAGDEVHTDFIPLPLGNRQVLKSASRSLMFYLNATTNITFSNNLSNFNLCLFPSGSGIKSVWTSS